MASVQVAGPERSPGLLVMRKSRVRFPKAARTLEASSDHGRGLVANGSANSRRACRVPCSGAVRAAALWDAHGLGEDVGRSGLGGADHVGVHAEGDRGVGVAQAGRDHMH
jgi:hypothetical protein